MLNILFWALIFIIFHDLNSASSTSPVHSVYTLEPSSHSQPDHVHAGGGRVVLHASHRLRDRPSPDNLAWLRNRPSEASFLLPRRYRDLGVVYMGASGEQSPQYHTSTSHLDDLCICNIGTVRVVHELQMAHKSNRVYVYIICPSSCVDTLIDTFAHYLSVS